MKNLNNASLEELSSAELLIITGGKKEWLLAGWLLNPVIGAFSTGVWIGYNE